MWGTAYVEGIPGHRVITMLEELGCLESLSLALLASKIQCGPSFCNPTNSTLGLHHLFNVTSLNQIGSHVAVCCLDLRVSSKHRWSKYFSTNPLKEEVVPPNIVLTRS